MHCKAIFHGSYSPLKVFRVEDKSTRYVAEDNIVLIRPDVPRGLMPLAGKYFKRWDKDSKCFISNIKDEYPDD